MNREASDAPETERGRRLHVLVGDGDGGDAKGRRSSFVNIWRIQNSD